MKFIDIKYQPEKGKCFLGAPSLVRLPDGALLVSHYYCGEGAARSRQGKDNLTSIYRSEDEGQTWENIAHISDHWGAMFFVHNDAVYSLGRVHPFGSIVIRRSNDGGYSWTNPTDSRHGFLFQADPNGKDPKYHGESQLTVFNGRVYKSVENKTSDIQGFCDFKSGVLSASLDSDLLNADSWTLSNFVDMNPEQWIPDFDQYEDVSYGNHGWGWLEGAVVPSPDGRLFNILRAQSPLRKWEGHGPSSEDIGFNQERADACENSDHAIMLEISENGKRQTLDPKTALIDFPGGGIGRFIIRRDPVTGLYLSLVNRSPDAANKFHYWRNILSLSCSRDLIHWQLAGKILEDDSGLSMAQSREMTGFQYPDWLISGDDIYYICRTSYRGSHNAHDANRITFHVLKNFRDKLKNRSVLQ